MKFSILIPTWNNLPFLKLCIRSIEQNSQTDHEILIHINDGSDGTLEWVKENGYKYIHTKENIGVCWALNGLRSMVTTDYIVFVNDDMYMCPGWDKSFADEIRNIPDKLFFLASSTIQPEGHKLRPIGVPVSDFGRTPDEFREEDLIRYASELEIPDTCGCVWPPNIVHRDLWDLVGGYSIEFSPGLGSDPDFSAKLYMAGVRCFKTLGTSLCYHFMSVSVNRITKNKGRVQFLRKWNMTVHAFLEHYLHIDVLWTECTDTRPILPKCRIYGSMIKRVFTCLKKTHAAEL